MSKCSTHTFTKIGYLATNVGTSLDDVHDDVDPNAHYIALYTFCDDCSAGRQFYGWDREGDGSVSGEWDLKASGD